MERLPDFDALWDFAKPADVEAKLLDLLPACTGHNDLEYRVELLTQIARTQGLQRRFDDADRSLDDAALLLGERHTRPRVRLVMERGRVLNSSGRKDEAKPLFVEAWDLARALGEDGLAVDAAHMVAIAEKGVATLRWNLIALDLAERSLQPAARVWRKSLHNNLGWTYHDAKDYDRALEHFEQSRLGAEEIGDAENESIARWCIARTKRSMGRYQESLEIQLELETRRGATGYGEEEIGECLLALGRADEAKPHFKNAHELLAPDIWLQANEPDRLNRLLSLSGSE